jgi:hypothetical protein
LGDDEVERGVVGIKCLRNDKAQEALPHAQVIAYLHQQLQVSWKDKTKLN